MWSDILVQHTVQNLWGQVGKGRKIAGRFRPQKGYCLLRGEHGTGWQGRGMWDIRLVFHVCKISCPYRVLSSLLPIKILTNSLFLVWPVHCPPLFLLYPRYWRQHSPTGQPDYMFGLEYTPSTKHCHFTFI